MIPTQCPLRRGRNRPNRLTMGERMLSFLPLHLPPWAAGISLIRGSLFAEAVWPFWSHRLCRRFSLCNKKRAASSRPYVIALLRWQGLPPGRTFPDRCGHCAPGSKYPAFGSRSGAHNGSWRRYWSTAPSRNRWEAS